MNNRSNLVKNWILATYASVALAPATGVVLAPNRLAAMTSENAKAIIAIAVRRQGFQCKRPISANRVNRKHMAHEAVWMLRCTGASYKIRFILDMKADITRLQTDRAAD